MKYPGAPKIRFNCSAKVPIGRAGDHEIHTKRGSQEGKAIGT